MKERFQRFVKNASMALGHTMLEDPELIALVVLIGFVIVIVCVFVFPAYTFMADARPEILSINSDKLL